VVFTRRLIVLAALPLVPLAFSGASPALLLVAVLANLAWIAAATIDYLRCPRPESVLEAQRRTDDALSVAIENAVSVRVQNTTAHSLRGELRDEPPGAFPRTGERQCRFHLAPFGETALAYTVTPPARGDFAFGDIYLRVVGPLGLVVRTGTLPAARQIPVFPDIKAVGEYELQLRRTQRGRAGARRIRITGGGREFASLRDYTPDDEFRVIDWKATARRGRVTSRTFEAERSQDVLLLLDLGRLMRQEIGTAQTMDHVVSAALMLAHVVARADDRIGLLTFADTPRTWLPPRRGSQQTTQLLHALYDARAEPVESDYRAAFRALATRWRKRSLVVLFTDLAGPEASAALLAEIRLLARNHVVCCVVVRDPLLSARARAVPDSVTQVYERAVAEETLSERRRALDLLSARGVLVVDSEPAELSAELIARYLRVKHQSLL
jgi:uncharacterized protein (DUF58 family)